MSHLSSRADAVAIARLRAYDTPTICNGLEGIDAGTRLEGYTRHTLHMAPADYRMPDGLKAICGRARTVRIESRKPSRDTAEKGSAIRADCYDHIAAGDGPTIVVVEDRDEEPLGAYWGEVHTALHRALGALGAVTNGVIRDLDDLDPDFLLLGGKIGPSHAYVRIVDYGQGASVFGMAVRDGDIVHADRHGAVVVPEAAVAMLPDAIADVVARERRLLDLTRADKLDMAALRALVGG